MTAKEISRAAGKIFQNTLPPNWAVRSQEDQEDYGIDYELEQIDANDHATGFIFKAQQKGEENLTLTPDNKSIIFSGLKAKRVKYYIDQLRMPVVFVAVGLDKVAAYWTMLQGNTDVRNACDAALAAARKTMTVYVPVENLLPDTFDQMLVAVQETNHWLVVQGLKSAPSTDLLTAALRDTNFVAAAEALAHHHDLFRCEQIEQELRARNLPNAFAQAEAIFASPSESVRMRFAAALNLLRVKPGLSSPDGSPPPGSETVDHRIKVTTALLKITTTKGADRQLRLYALFLARAARLRWLVQRDFALQASRRAQEQTGDELTIAFTDALRAPSGVAIIDHFRRLQKYLLWILKRNCHHFFAPAWAQLVRDLTPFIQRLWNDKLEDSARDLAKWLEGAGEVAIDISKRLGNWKDVVTCAHQGISLAVPIDDQTALTARFDAAEKVIEDVPDPVAKKHGMDFLAEQRPLVQNAEPNLADEAQMYRDMAAAMGVDLSNDTDEIAEVINIGIADLNPERVLKNCQHLFVQPGSVGIPGQMLGLRSAGSKHLRCVKHGHDISGLVLDRVYALMNQMNCASCPDRSPHAADWTWSHEWQAAQHNLHAANAASSRTPPPSAASTTPKMAPL